MEGMPIDSQLKELLHLNTDGYRMHNSVVLRFAVIVGLKPCTDRLFAGMVGVVYRKVRFASAALDLQFDRFSFQPNSQEHPDT
jgi:hypothetical protein